MDGGRDDWLVRQGESRYGCGGLNRG